MLKNTLIILGFLMLAHVKITAQDGSANLEFIENKGQWDGAILFKGELNNGAFFLQKKGFTVLLHNPEELARLREHNRFSRVAGSPGDPSALPNKNAGFYSDTSILHSHAYSMSFHDGNENVTVIPDKPLPSYNNYFIGNDRSRWAVNCRLYQAVTYKNVYPNIDIRYYTHEGQLKYDIVIHPGGDINRIALKYEGIDKLTLKNRRLIVKTSVGDVQELSPQSYQYNTSGRKEIECRYVLGKDNLVRFAAKNYSAGTTLVIDPSLVFSTFTGSRASNWGFTATPGPDGTFFAGGIVFGEGFPVSPGAFQSNFGHGTTDVGIIKFSSNGANRIYATYIGGGDNETPHSLFSDPQGNLVVLGRTYSTTDFPALTRVGNLGGADMFILKLSAGGNALIGSMLIGGVRDDCVNIEDQFRAGSEKAISLIRNYGDDTRSEVVLDRSNTIYVAASTRSPDFPVTAGAFQPTFGGTNQDGVVLKISADCSKVLFASFLGGTSDDAAFVLKVNPINNNIYVAGATASPDFPGNKTGTLQGTYQGGISDGFISIISNDGSTLQKTTFQGTSGSESIYGIEFDKKGFPYIMGTTTGNWTVTNNVGFVNAGAKQFISKLQPDLSAYIYSTTFGNPANAPNISPVAFLVDRCENVYVSGWGGWIFARTDPYGLSGSFGMPVTPDALKSATDGRDFYFIVIKKNASALLYATFFGQLDGPQSISEHVDGGTSRYDQFGVIYQAICANCNGGNLGPFPTTPGSWSPRNGTASGNSVGGCNLAAVKIAFNFAGVAAGLKSFINGRYDSSGCIPLQVTFDDTIKNAKQYIWNFGEGPDTMTTGFQVSHTYNNVGTYRVMLVAIDSNSCNISDTVYETIRARTDRAGINFTATKLPPCQSLTYQFENFSTAPPGKPFGPNSFSWDFGDGSPQDTAGLVNVIHTYLSAGTYIARLKMIDTTYCNYPDELTDTLRVAPLVKAQFVTPPAGCAPYNAVFDNTSLAGQQFFWDFGDGSTSTASSPTHFYPNVGNYTIKLVATDSATCNIIDSTSTTITVSPKPQAAFTSAPSPPAPNQPTIFSNTSVGATHYLWIFGDGDTAAKASADTVIHQYQQTGTFQACLVAFNVFECPDTVCHPVETIVNPLLDIPNAFTPGRFGQNSVIRVQGFGISSMIFRIYNRWGQMVFESNNPNQGWDGNYKGNPQPMDVYGYTLEATFFDGKKTTRTGDITLIR